MVIRGRGCSKVLTTLGGMVAGVALISVAGCASIGTKKLVSTHQGYNDAVQLAETREMLANIVRLRFSDPLQFLAVTQINSSSLRLYDDDDLVKIATTGKVPY